MRTRVFPSECYEQDYRSGSFPLKEFRFTMEDYITGYEDIPNKLNYNSLYSNLETTTSDKQEKINILLTTMCAGRQTVLRTSRLS